MLLIPGSTDKNILLEVFPGYDIVSIRKEKFTELLLLVFCKKAKHRIAADVVSNSSAWGVFFKMVVCKGKIVFTESCSVILLFQKKSIQLIDFYSPELKILGL